MPTILSVGSERELKLGARQAEVAPVIGGVGRQSLNLEWPGQFHNGGTSEDHRCLSSKKGRSLSGSIRRGGGTEPHKHDANLPLEFLEPAFEEDRQPGWLTVVGKEKVADRDETKWGATGL